MQRTDNNFTDRVAIVCLRSCSGGGYTPSRPSTPNNPEIGGKSASWATIVFVNNINVDENGKVILPVCEHGDYVIMLFEYSDRKGDVSNNGVTNALDASAILKDIVELDEAANPVMLDYNGDGKVNALDASSILIDIVNGII